MKKKQEQISMNCDVAIRMGDQFLGLPFSGDFFKEVDSLIVKSPALELFVQRREGNLMYYAWRFKHSNELWNTVYMCCNGVYLPYNSVITALDKLRRLNDEPDTRLKYAENLFRNGSIAYDTLPRLDYGSTLEDKFTNELNPDHIPLYARHNSCLAVTYNPIGYFTPHTTTTAQGKRRYGTFAITIITTLLIALCIGIFIRNLHKEETVSTTKTATKTIKSNISKVEKDTSKMRNDISKTDNKDTVSKADDESFRSFRIGKGSISIPNFLKYIGESDEGSQVFSNGMIYLFVMIDEDYPISLSSVRKHIIEEFGNGLKPTYEFKKSNFVVVSGYNEDGEIYYTKAYMDYRGSKTSLYLAHVRYPSSERKRIDHLMAKIFNPFPNIK